MNYLDLLPQHIHRDNITVIHQDRQRWVNQQKKGFLRYRAPFETLLHHRAETVECSNDTVTIGAKEEVTSETREIIAEQLRAFMPWRKGPFSVFGVDIDAEWRSERKWQRLESFLPDLEGKTIADIGCNNGYYMFRMTPFKPKLVLGFEPSVQHYYCFKSLNSMAGFTTLDIDLLGVEHINLFPESFDIIFLMGVIYHRPSPVEVLRDILASLKPGGTLIIESQAIPGADPIALFPEKTYAKVPGTYFVPMSSYEQRRTEWMVFESYSDFIDRDNSSLTVEGHPAPWRVFLRATKK